MSPEELRQLLVREDERLEWKRSSRDVSEILQAVCALANDLGHTRRPGGLLIGVEKNGAVSGVEARGSELDNEQRILSDRLRSVKLWPTPSFDIHIVEYEGKNVFAVQVAPYAVPPIVTVDAVAWVRQGSTTRRATEADIQRLRERRPENHHPFDLRPWHGATLADLNQRPLEKMYEDAREEVEDQDLFPSLESWLTQVQLGVEVRGTWTPGAGRCGPHSARLAPDAVVSPAHARLERWLQCSLQWLWGQGSLQAPWGDCSRYPIPEGGRAMQKKNAVLRRLDKLHDQWVEFAEQPGARLLRWVVEAEEVRMVEAWLKKEEDERAGECPDLFLRFDTPFEQPEAYGHELRKVLEAMVAESGEPVELGKVKPGQSGAEAFLSACEALQRQYAEVCEVLAVVLVPQQVSNAKAWQQWLWKALDHLRSPQVRLVVLEDAQARMLEPMAQMESRRVWTAVAELDVMGALHEVALQGGRQHAEGARYRELLALLAGAAQRGELKQVERLGGDAVQVATQQGWHGLAVAARWVVAGALLAAGKPQEAAERYRQAEVAAAEAEAKGEAQGAELRLKTRVALGAALVAAQHWAPAAALYEETAPLARTLKDSHLELECWRMGSFCREPLRELDKALANASQAWEVGKGLEPQARATSTLPYVAEALVRLVQARQGEVAARHMEAEADALLGPGWRSSLQAAGGQAA